MKSGNIIFKRWSNQPVPAEAAGEEEELEAKNMQLVKKEELLKKDAELVKKNQELEIKQKQLEALEVKMKGMKNGCTSCCGFMSVFVLGLFFALLINARSN